jgi:hypothetical protein
VTSPRHCLQFVDALEGVTSRLDLLIVNAARTEPLTAFDIWLAKRRKVRNYCIGPSLFSVQQVCRTVGSACQPLSVRSSMSSNCQIIISVVISSVHLLPSAGAIAEVTACPQSRSLRASWTPGANSPRPVRQLLAENVETPETLPSPIQEHQRNSIVVFSLIAAPRHWLHHGEIEESSSR